MEIDMTAVIDAAARGFWNSQNRVVDFDHLSPVQQHNLRETALAFLTEAVPLVEAQAREQVAQEIEAAAEHTPTPTNWYWHDGMSDAAGIARNGTEEET